MNSRTFKKRFCQANSTVLAMGLVLILSTLIFWRTDGFIHTIRQDGSPIYSHELQSLGSDADAAVWMGVPCGILVIISTILLRKRPLFRTLVGGTLTAITLLLFWGMTSAEIADVWATVAHDFNLPLLIWLFSAHLLFPAIAFQALLQSRKFSQRKELMR